MMIIKNIAIVFAALSVGGTFILPFAIARCGKGIIRTISMIAVTVAALGLAVFASTYNTFWFWGIVIGYVFGLFALSLCIVGGNSDKIHNELEEMRG